MNFLVPSQWGRPPDNYVGDYNMDGAVDDLLSAITKNSDSDHEIQKILSISTGGEDALKRITISTIKTLLRLPYSPYTYPKLASPGLIHGYELGYSCFRLVTTCIGACLLQNVDVLAFVDKTTESRPALVTPIVEAVISHAGGRDREDHNCVLGWSSCPKHANDRPQIVVSLSDTRLLMEMLYADRYLFLKASRSTHSPGLSAVVFLIWRYVNYQRFLRGPAATKQLIQPLYDILNRCWLVSTVYQHNSFLYMYQWGKDLWTAWDDASVITVTSEDSREIVRAFTHHLAQINVHSESSMSLHHLSNTLFFLGARILPVSEDLLGNFMGALVERIWFAVIHQEPIPGHVPLAEAVEVMFNWVKTILKRLHNSWDANPVPLMRIINALVDAGLLELVGRTIFLVDTELPTSLDSPGSMANFKILHGTRELFRDISNSAPRPFVEMQFKPFQPAWWKVYRHFQFMNLVIDPGQITPLGNRWGFYALCSETWDNILSSISAPSDINERIMVACNYSRCQDPGILAGAEYSCSWCWRVRYCSPRCQAMDWMNRTANRAHRILCARYRTGDAAVLVGLQQFEFTGGAYG